MATKQLTTRTIKGLEAEGDHYTTYWDEKFSGPGSFGLQISPTTGSKSFVIMARNKNGTQKKHTIGRFDPQASGMDPEALTLSEARSKAQKEIVEIRESEQTGGPVKTFSDLAEEFDEKHISKKADSTQRMYRQRLQKYLLPELQDKQLDDIDRSDIHEIMDYIEEERNSPSVADRTKKLAHNIFNFGIERGHVSENPCKGIKNRRTEKEDREKYLDKEEIQTFWNVLESESLLIRSLFRMILIAGQRPGETKKMKWENITDEKWVIPAEDTKNGTRHTVYLSDLAKEVLEKIKTETGDSKWVFRSPSPMSDSHINYLGDALSRVRDKCDFDEVNKEPFTLHDLRRTAATHIAHLEGVTDTVLEKVLNHISHQQNVTARYDRHEREETKKEALRKWSQKLADVVGIEYNFKDSETMDGIREEIEELEDRLREMDLKDEVREEMDLQLKTIHCQLDSKEPSEVIIEEARRKIREYM